MAIFMTREERLKQCLNCKNRKFDEELGTICGLTDYFPTFTGVCKDFIEESREVRLERLAKEQKIATTKRNLNQGRYVVLFIGLFYIIMGVFEGFYTKDHQLLYGIIDWGIASFYIAFGVWSFFKPYPAFVLTLIFYSSLVVLFSILDPINIINGITWKILVIAFLVYTIKIARKEHIKNKAIADGILDQL